MTDAIRHRGPDDSGIWFDESVGLGLGHRRLSILDLSSAGHQPMMSASKKYSIVFNGEIYNHSVLKQDLINNYEKLLFRGHSDTEVLLAAFDYWGVMPTMSRLNGMFAFALYDRSERVLYLSRDRIGEKPLYFGFTGSTLIFASELRAFQAAFPRNFDIDKDALNLYFHFGYVPAPRSILNGISKVEPGHIMAFRLAENTVSCRSNIAYWSARDVVLGNQLYDDPGESINELDRLLRDAVRIRMEADVPLGAFLSGGIDSSLITSLMQSQSRDQVRTFTIGFDDAEFNEAPYAKAIANYLGTEHTELYVSPRDALEIIPLLPDIFDEPFADVSQIPTYLVARMAREHVTVALSGDGGDELFAGYQRYLIAQKLWRFIEKTPYRLRKVTASMLRNIPISWWDKVDFMIPRALSRDRLGDRIHKFSEILDTGDFDSLYLRLISLWNTTDRLLPWHVEKTELLNAPSLLQGINLSLPRMMAWDLVTYLPDDILTKIDRSTMAVSLEGRIPLLDHRIIEYAWRLPASLKMHDNKGKWPLRQVLYKYLPNHLIDRPKKGFRIPLESWLRNDLAEWVHDILNPRILRDQGLINPTLVNEMLEQHMTGKRAWTSQLWSVLMFQSWYQSTMNS